MFAGSVPFQPVGNETVPLRMKLFLRGSRYLSCQRRDKEQDDDELRSRVDKLRRREVVDAEKGDTIWAGSSSIT